MGLLFILLGNCAFLAEIKTKLMYSLLIKNATVIDGTGAPAELLDVAVSGDEIVNIAKNITTSAQTVLDGTGKVLTPGFIDAQNHSDSYWQLFDNPGLDSLITQGYTSILIGQCGASLAPLLSADSLLSIQKWHNLQGANLNWQSFSEYMAELGRRRFSCNVGSLVGYSTMRRGIIGDEVRSLEQGEINALKNALEQAMDAGAFGLSSGLSYAHEIIISELELFELAKIVSSRAGLLSVHLRNESGEIVEAVEEALDIARATGVNLKISHLKIRGEHNWDKAPVVLEQLENAYHRGMPVHFDMYPYDTIWQALYTYLPKWAVEGGRTIMLKHFANPVSRNKILTYLNNSEIKFSNIRIASTANNLSFVGKTIGQVAKNLEVSSEQAVLHLIQNGGSEVLVFEQNLNPDTVHMLQNHALALIASDGGGFAGAGKTLVHPRCFGAATKFIKETLRHQEISLEDAIRKLTSEPAKVVGFKKRGVIAVGNYADLVMFEKDKISDNSTYENPYQFSKGISYVFVNGKPVVQNSLVTGEMPGYVLRK